MSNWNQKRLSEYFGLSEGRLKNHFGGFLMRIDGMVELMVVQLLLNAKKRWVPNRLCVWLLKKFIRFDVYPISTLLSTDDKVQLTDLKEKYSYLLDKKWQTTHKSKSKKPAEIKVANGRTLTVHVDGTGFHNEITDVTSVITVKDPEEKVVIRTSEYYNDLQFLLNTVIELEALVNNKLVCFPPLEVNKSTTKEKK